MAASTRWDMRGSAGEAKRPIAASANATGTKNQKDLPKSVTKSKISISHSGRVRAKATARASMTVIVAAIIARKIAVPMPSRSDWRHTTFAANLGSR